MSVNPILFDIDYLSRGGEVSGSDFEPNELLETLRKLKRSSIDPGKCMSRSELAVAVNDYLAIHHPDQVGSVDLREIGKYERGVIRWPGKHKRDALRYVLSRDSGKLLTDAELGFFHFWTRKQPDHTGTPELGETWAAGISELILPGCASRLGMLVLPHAIVLVTDRRRVQ